jgi:hypothetical protein
VYSGILCDDCMRDMNCCHLLTLCVVCLRAGRSGGGRVWRDRQMRWRKRRRRRQEEVGLRCSSGGLRTKSLTDPPDCGHHHQFNKIASCLPLVASQLASAWLSKLSPIIEGFMRPIHSITVTQVSLLRTLEDWPVSQWDFIPSRRHLRLRTPRSDKSQRRGASVVTHCSPLFSAVSTRSALAR